MNLPLRRYVAVTGVANATELDGEHVVTAEHVNMHRACLVVIDAWEDHPITGWLKRAQQHMQTHLAPLLALARRQGWRIAHASHEGRPAALAAPLENEFVISTREAFLAYLKAHNVDTLFYAGYASNWCVLSRPTGIIAMHDLGFKIVLIRDCVLGIETPATLRGEWCNYAAINMVEHTWGTSTALDDLRAASGDQTVDVEPIGSHLPVLFALRPRPRFVVEYGAGLQSTRAFLSYKHFPELQRLISFETSSDYYQMLLRRMPVDPRWDMSLVTTEDIHTFTLHAQQADLVLIDNHPQDARIAVLRAVLAERRRGIVAMHDAENAVYQEVLRELIPHRIETPIVGAPATALWFP